MVSRQHSLPIAAVLAVPAWYAAISLVYLLGIAFFGWPMNFGPIQPFDYCNAGQNCARPNPLWLKTALEWLLMPTRLGVVYFAVVGVLIYRGFPVRRSTRVSALCFWFSCIGPGLFVAIWMFVIAICVLE
jgi:hypothetical protein